MWFGYIVGDVVMTNLPLQFGCSDRQGWSGESAIGYAPKINYVRDGSDIGRATRSDAARDDCDPMPAATDLPKESKCRKSKGEARVTQRGGIFVFHASLHLRRCGPAGGGREQLLAASTVTGWVKRQGVLG